MKIMKRNKNFLICFLFLQFLSLGAAEFVQNEVEDSGLLDFLFDLDQVPQMPFDGVVFRSLQDEEEFVGEGRNSIEVVNEIWGSLQKQRVTARRDIKYYCLFCKVSFCYQSSDPTKHKKRIYKECDGSQVIETANGILLKK